MNDINTDIDSLRTKCSDATKEEAQEIWQKMEAFLEKHPKAKGLASIQLVPPIYKRVIIINEYKTVDGKIQLKGRVRMFNPTIIKAINPITVKGEGCLSLPEYSKRVRKTQRYGHIIVEDGNYGKTCWDENEVDMLTLVAVQHETDHTNGILYMDRVQKPMARDKPKVGRNDPCPECLKEGIKIKYKKCKKHYKQ